jgi:serine/threonine protein kinase
VGVIHGDLRCENVVVDENDNALIIDISDGWGYMVGWNAVLDDREDPRRDIYSIGVTIWELIHDGEDPPGISIALPIDWRGKQFGDNIEQLVEECVVEFADKRPSLAKVIETLGGSVMCGCETS